MRLGTWNCQMALHKKRDAMRGLKCDVLVLPEAAEGALPAGASALFQGPPGKGLAVLGFDGWTVRRGEDVADQHWLIMAEVVDPREVHVLDLAAVWTRKAGPHTSYARQFAAVLDHLADRPPSSVPLVLAGDLNTLVRGPSSRPHLRNLARARDLGLESAYHFRKTLDHGAEDTMTLRMIREGGLIHEYHCDYVFLDDVGQEALRGVEVGDLDQWHGKISDHVPVVVELAL